MINLSVLFHTFFLFWIVLDPIGNLPIFVNALKHFEPHRQRAIIVRELLIALVVMLLFLFFGQGFFILLNIEQPALEITGGVILFLIGARMLFSEPNSGTQKKLKEEPFIVPLAVPAVAGPGILATIALYGGNQQIGTLTVLLAIVLSWAATLPFLLLAPYLKKIFKENGLVVVERLSAYLVILIAVQMAIQGLLNSL